MKTLRIFLVLIVSVAIFAACEEKKVAKKSDSKPKTSKSATSDAAAPGVDMSWDAEPKMTIDTAKTYTATMETTKGTIVFELYAKDAPHAVNNFVFLAGEGYYKNVPFHRVMKDFMIQSGDPTGTGTGGPGYTIEDDKVTRKYEKGTLAMANTGAPNSGGGQFFICHGTNCTTLPPTYPIFGKVSDGLDVVDAIANVDVEMSDSGEPSAPTEKILIKSITITSN